MKPTMNANDLDGYIAHFSPDGTTLLHATYVGTNKLDQCFFIQLDALENIYVLGQTLGNYPMSAGVYGKPRTGQFIQKIDPTLTTGLLSTTFGNATNAISIVPTAFLVNNCDNILISGWGGNVNHYLNAYSGGTTFGLDVTGNALYKTTDGSDFYLLVLEKGFNSLLYATYYGGYGEDDHVDGGTSRFDKNGIVYQSVCGSCGGTSFFPVTPNAQSKTNNSYNCNNACFKYDLTTLRADFDIDKTTGCDSLTVHLTNRSEGGSSYEWDLGDGTKINGPGPITHFYKKPGTYIIKFIVTDLTTCIGKDTARKTVTIYPMPSIGVNLSDTTICNGDTISILKNCNPYYNYSWSPATEVINPNVCGALFHPTQTRSYYLSVTDTNKCVLKDTILINVATLSAVIDWENLTACNGRPTARLFNPSSGPLHYFWTFGDGHSSTDVSPIHEYPNWGTYPVAVNVYNDYCAATAVGTVTINEIIIPNLFTPNGDTKNDCFEIKGLYPNWHVEIYNAWSKCVFKSESYKNDFCGEEVSSSVYYYWICAPYGDCCKSWVQIIKEK
jgi:gliding motility-associated-like protein